MQFSREDLDRARDAGILNQRQVDALVAFFVSRRDPGDVEQEHFRLLTGFNDIFVSLACALVLIAAGSIGGKYTLQMGLLVAGALSWGLAEYFTRVRRMALPSILLATVFVGAIYLASGEEWGTRAPLVPALAALAAAGLHWWRFRVPITVAQIAAVAVLLINEWLERFPGIAGAAWPVVVQGLIVLGLAIWWDSTDRLRRTRRGDVAFWLHLLAAPLIVHPIMAPLTIDTAPNDITAPAAILFIYMGLTIVSLLLDRRALMVSALIYAVVAAVRGAVLFGPSGYSLAVGALVVGGALLVLSALWQTSRRKLMRLVPEPVATRLPTA